MWYGDSNNVKVLKNAEHVVPKQIKLLKMVTWTVLTDVLNFVFLVNHNTTNRSCPLLLKQKSIKECMAHWNISFTEFQKAVDNPS